MSVVRYTLSPFLPREEMAKKFVEFEFNITRTQGLIGLRVKWDQHLSGGGLFVTGFIEPCMASQLGYLEIADELVLVDGKPVKSETDINFYTDRVDTDLVTVKVRRLFNPNDDQTLKKFGQRYINQFQVIQNLKTTLRKDHIDIADATLKLAELVIETGDYPAAKTLIEEALNNAFGTAAGVNLVVAGCYCAQAQIAYKTRKFPDARRNLWEAVEMYKKISGTMAQIHLLHTYLKLLAVADAQESAEDREFTKKKADDLQQQIIAAQLSSTNHAEIFEFATVLLNSGDLDDARDCFERVGRLAQATSSTNPADIPIRQKYLESLLSIIPIRLNMKKYDVARQDGQTLARLIDEIYPDEPQPSTPSPQHNLERYNSLGLVGLTMVWNENCDYEKAKELLLQSYSSHQYYYGRIHSSVAFISHFLAIVYRKLKQFHTAIHYHHMAIRIYEILLGEKNLVTAASVGELGITVQSRASFQMDVSEQIMDSMYIDMKRSNQSPFNALQLFTSPFIRGAFYEHFNEVNRRSLPPVAAKSEKVIPTKAITGQGEGPASFLIERGNQLFNDECDYNSARVLFQQCYNYLCTAIGPTANLTLLTLYRLADSTRELGNYREANTLYDQAVAQYLTNAGDKVGLAYAYYGWGESYLALGDPDQAKQHFTESLTILRNQIQLGMTGIELFLPEMGLIKVLIMQCKWTESIRQLERLINKMKSDLGSNHIMIAHASILMAKSKRGKGLYSEIKPALDQAFVILRNIVDENHLYFGHALYELSEYYHIMDEIQLAKEKYDLTLPIYENYYTHEHDMVYKCRTSIALFQYDLGHINNALNEFTEILKGRERIFGSNHLLVGESHLYIGDCLRVLGHFERATDHFEQAEKLVKKILTTEHPLYATLRFSEAELARAHGKMEKARNLYNESMKIRRDNYGKEHPDYIQSMQGKADLDSNCDSNMEEIITLLKRILKFRKKLFGDDHTSLATTFNTYGLVLKQQNKYHEALEKFQEALRIRLDNSISDPNHYTIGEIKNNIALLQAGMVENEDTEDVQAEEEKNEVKYTADGRVIYEPKPPVEHYEGVTDITPVFVNTKYRKAIEDMYAAIDHILISFPGTPQYQHPLVANIRGNIGLIERLEDEGKRDFILRLTTKQRALFREAEEKRLTEEYANMSADFSDAAAGSVKLLEAIDYLHEHGYDSYHPWLRKFESLISKNLKEIPSDAEPQNAQQLKANRKLLEARDRMKRRLYNEAKKYYEETLQRLPEAEGRPEDMLSYAMTGECLNGLADIARIYCKLSEAKDFYHRSLSILKKVNGNDTLQYAEALLGYSDLLQLQGEYLQSNQNIDEVITIKKRLLGEKHESIVDCLFKRCVIMYQTGRYSEGYELCEYILDARLKFPQTHQDFDLTIQVAETYNLMAEYYLVKGNYDKCENCLQMTFKTCRNKVVLELIDEEDHNVLADSYHIKGMCRLKQNKFKDALRNFGHALSMKMRLLKEIRKIKTGPGDNENEQASVNKKAMDPMEYCHVSIAISLYGQAEALRKDGNYQIAADLYLKATRMYGAIYQGQDNPAVADVMFGQAENYRLFGKYSSSEKIYQTVLAMRQRIYSTTSPLNNSGNENHPDIADSYIGLGLLRYDQCLFQDSIVYFEKALAIKKIVYSSFTTSSSNTPVAFPSSSTTSSSEVENIQIGQLYLYLGMAHLEMGHYETAEELYTKTSLIYKSYFPESNPVLCPVLLNQAKLYQIQQKFNDANVLYNLIVSVVSMAYGEAHPEVGIYVLHQSWNQLLLGNHKEAKILAQRSLQVFNKIYGADHPNTIQALLAIARSLQMAGKYLKSLPYFQRSLDMILKSFPQETTTANSSGGLNHLLVAECYYELGNCLFILGRYSEAKEQFQHAHEIRRTILTNDHLDTLRAWSSFAEADQCLGNLTEAEQVQANILKQLPSIIPDKLLLFQATVMSRLGRTIQMKGKFVQAKQLYERSLYIRQKVLGTSHQLVAETWTDIGRVLSELGKYEQGKGYFEKAYSLYRQIYQENHPLFSACLFGIAQCTRLMGQPMQAQGMFIKAILGFVKELGINHPDYYQMMIYFGLNRADEGYIYSINSDDYFVPNLSADSPIYGMVDLTNPDALFDNLENSYAYPIVAKSYQYFQSQNYSPRHYLILEIQNILSNFLLSLGKFLEAQLLQKELLPLYKNHYNKEYQYLASTLFSLAEIERASGKLSAKKKIYKGTGKPDLSVESLTGEKNRMNKLNKIKHQKLLLSSSQPILPRIQSIAEKSRSPVKKKTLGFMGYQYPDIKTNDIDPSSPIDHLILNEIEVALREKEAIAKGSSGIQNESDPSITMINEPKRLYDIALQLHIERYPDFNDHPFTGDIYFGRAELHRQRKEFEDAHIFYKKCYNNRLKNLRGGHPLIASTLFGLAENYRQSGNLKDAKVYYDQSLAMRIQAFGAIPASKSRTLDTSSKKILIDIDETDKDRFLDVHISLAESLYGLSQWHFEKGLFKEAIKLCNDSLQIRRLKLGKTHYLTLANHQLLSTIAYSLQEYQQANELFFHLLPIYKIIYGTSHLQFITCLNNYAMLLKSQSLYDNALKIMKKIFSFQSKIYGPIHPEIATTLHNLGAIYSLQLNHSNALKYYQQSYEMKLICNSDMNATIALSLYSLAGTYYQLQNYNKSLELYRESYDIQSNLYDTAHPSLADTLHNLGLVLDQLKQYEESEIMYQKALEMKRSLYGSEHLLTSHTLHNLAILYHHQMKLSQAKRYYQECHQIRLKCVGKDHIETINCQNNLKMIKFQEIIQIEKNLMRGNRIQYFK